MGIGNIIGGGLSLIGGIAGSKSANKSADAQVKASQQAAALQKEMFDTTRGDLAPWRETGANALSALAYETGLGARPTFGGSKTAAPAIQEIRTAGVKPETFAQMRMRLQQNPTSRAPTSGLESTRYSVGGKTFGDMASATKFANSQVKTTPGTPYRGFEATPGYAFRFGEGTKAVERSAAARGALDSGATQKALTRFGQGIAADEYTNYINRLSALAGTGQTATAQTGAFGQASANNQSDALMAGGAARASGYAGSNNALQGTLQNLSYFGARAFG